MGERNPRRGISFFPSVSRRGSVTAFDMEQRFSIVTVCLNEAASIRKTCESVRAQEWTDFEWIVMDGGSTDGTLEILREFEDRISVLESGRDGGIFAAMNKGLARCRGEQVLFLNGGDRLAGPDALLEVAAQPVEDVVYGDLYLQQEGGVVLGFPDHLDKKVLLKKMLPHQATFYRRRLFDELGGYDTSYRIAGDYELHVRWFSARSLGYFHLAKPLAVFDQTGISSDCAWRELRKRENHRIRKAYYRGYRWSPKAWRQEVRERLAGRLLR